MGLHLVAVSQDVCAEDGSRKHNVHGHRDPDSGTLAWPPAATDSEPRFFVYVCLNATRACACARARACVCVRARVFVYSDAAQASVRTCLSFVRAGPELVFEPVEGGREAVKSVSSTRNSRAVQLG